MREEFATDMQALKKEVAEVVETVNAIAAAHLRLTESHLQLAEAHRQLTEAHTILELRAAETEAKLNALIDIVSRQQPRPRDYEEGPPAPPLP
jgi:small-conductance mechanosensitive channel